MHSPCSPSTLGTEDGDVANQCVRHGPQRLPRRFSVAPPAPGRDRHERWSSATALPRADELVDC
jgi:hypothetical protein